MQIIEALKILAETKDNQIVYLTDLGVIPSTDELPIQFDDAYQIFKWKFEESAVDPVYKSKVLNNLNTIKLIFDKMSNMPHNIFWDISSLDNIEWVNIRTVAGETLPLIINLEV